MARYHIENTHTGIALGEYEGETEAQALDAMAREAGYKDYAEAETVAPSQAGEIVVTRLDTAS